MLLHKVLNEIPILQVIGSPELVDVDNITIDSRSVTEGSIFVAIKGYNLDGHKFIPEAISKGAAAIVIEDDSADVDGLLNNNDVVKILVSNTRKSLPLLSNEVYGSPSKELNLIGITGTKGKTTTSFFIKSIFENNGRKSGLIGTNKNLIGNKQIPTKLTTPESNTINDLLSKMVKAKCSDCVMEVSSHSLELSRVDGLDFNVGIFTNITSDHLDYHSTFGNYLNAKKKLFDNLSSTSFIIYNKDDENYSKVIEDSPAKKISYSSNTPGDFQIENIEYSLDGTIFNLVYKNNSYKVQTKLIGKFNAYNASAAIGAAVASGVTINDAVKGIELAEQVPGRFEVISNNKKKIIVDYSHTSDSLKQALEAVRHIVNETRKVYTVFGCGGDRDKSKRPLMGSIAEELSDFCFVTSDNPRTEDPYEILKDIETGLKHKDKYKIIEDREKAIKTAIEQSEDDGVILIAGKGHENYQEINGIRNYFSDKEVAIKYL